jgi:hypothetical protein
MSDRYLVALAFHADNPGKLSPSQASLAQYENTLSVRYDGAIRTFLTGEQLDPAELRYIAVLAVLSAGQTVAAQVRDACRFYRSVKPQVPPSGSSAFVARETLAHVTANAMTTFGASIPRKQPARTKSARKRTGTKKSVRRKKRSKKGR